MALSLNDLETDRFAREVAELSGKSLTEAVRCALIDRLARIGDYFAHAAAKVAGERLLFKGDDFAHTDIPSARPV
jgi:hypothetical protein